METKTRYISVIAQEIIQELKQEYLDKLRTPSNKPKHWKEKYAHAMPYLNAMLCLNNITDNYGLDSARSIIAYALGNLTIWKGEKAKAIKKELNSLIK